MPTREKKNKTATGSRGWAVVAFLVLALVLAVVGFRLFTSGDAPLTVGETVDDFSLTTFSGEVYETSTLRGRVVLINFWASWCATCDQEAILLEKAWAQYRDSEEVLFLGVAYMDTEVGARDFLAVYGVTFPNGMDLGGKISNIYQVSAVPETYILDSEGRLAYVKYGPFTSLDEILTAVAGVLD